MLMVTGWCLRRQAGCALAVLWCTCSRCPSDATWLWLTVLRTADVDGHWMVSASPGKVRAASPLVHLQQTQPCCSQQCCRQLMLMVTGCCWRRQARSALAVLFCICSRPAVLRTVDVDGHWMLLVSPGKVCAGSPLLHLQQASSAADS